MDSIGDWLYIVVLIITVASGLFSSKREKTPKRNQRTDREAATQRETVPQGNSPDIFEEGQDIFEEEEEEPWPEEEKADQTAGMQERRKPEPVSVNFFERPDTRIERPAPRNESVTSVPDSGSRADDLGLNSAAGLQKAVICAEILNRKY